MVKKIIALFLSFCIVTSVFGEETEPVLDTTQGAVTAFNQSDDIYMAGGSFTYNYPIQLPPGINGLTPSLSVNYNSAGGTGLLGLGFDLNGLSSIKRDTTYGINWNTSDHYLLDGQRLILEEIVTGGAEGPVEKYSPENSPYVNLEFIRNYNKWRVYTKDGLVKYYGESATTRVIPPNPVDPSQPVEWLLDKIENPLGQTINFEYSVDSLYGDIYPTKITYEKRTIDFHYETKRDVTPMYSPGFVNQDKRLSWIVVKMNGSLYSKFHFEYDYKTTANNKYPEISRLVKITQYGNDGDTPPSTWTDGISNSGPHNNFPTYTNPTGTTLPPTTFVWENVDLAFYDLQGITDNPLLDPTGDGTSVRMIDVNGDGKSDLVSTLNGTPVYVALSKNDRFEGPWDGITTAYPSDISKQFADMNGDGKVDMIVTRTEYDETEEDFDVYASVYLSNGTGYPNYDAPSWVEEKVYSYASSAHKTHMFLEVNGDGLSDMVIFDKSSPTGYLTGGVAVILASNQTGLRAVHSSGNVLPDGQSFSKLLPGDVTGDGKTDLVAVVPNSGSIIGQVRVYASNGVSFAEISRKNMVEAGEDGKGLYLSDVNGDGKSDFVGLGSVGTEYAGKLYVWLSNGTGFGDEPVWEKNLMDPTNPGDRIYFTDVNGDGKSDLAAIGKPNHPDDQGKLYIALSDGNGFGDTWSYSTALFETNEDGRGVFFTDTNGDGKSDIVSVGNPEELWGLGYPGAYAGQVFVTLNKTHSDLVNKVDNGKGGTIAVTYEPASSFPNIHNLNDTNTTIQVNKALRNLVKTLSYSDGHQNTSTYTYDYYNARVRRGLHYDRKNLGFGMVVKNNPDGSRVDTLYYQDEVFGGRVKSRVTYGTDSKMYTKKDYTYDYIETASSNPALYNSIKEIRPKTEVFSNFNAEDGYWGPGGEWIGVQPVTSTTTYMSYSEWGDPTYIFYNNDDSYVNDDAAVEYDYAMATGRYMVKQTSKRTFAYNLVEENFNILTDAGLSSQVLYYYDGLALGSVGAKGLVTKVVNKSRAGDLTNFPDQVSEYTHDDYGNVLTEKVNGRLISTTTYDSMYYTFPSTVTNNLGHKTTYYYDLNMRNNRTSDPNGVETKTFYDAFGRVSKVVRPGDSDASPSAVYYYSDTYDPSVFPNYTTVHTKNTIYSNSAEYHEATTHADGWGRTIQTNTEGQNGNWITTNIYYDVMGRKSMVSVPHSRSTFVFDLVDYRANSKPFSQTEYDPIGRVFKVTNQAGERTVTLYRDRSVFTIDGENHVTCVETRGNEKYAYTYDDTKDYSGAGEAYSDFKTWLGNFTVDYRTTWYGKTTVKTARDGNIITQHGKDGSENRIITYKDLLGRNMNYRDPDMGLYFYTYDQYGQLKSQTDAKNQEITFAYDELGRITQKNYPDQTAVTYAYDETAVSSYEKGKLTTITYPDGYDAFAYDNRGRVAAKTRTVTGYGTKTITYDYDTSDRVTDEYYPILKNETNSTREHVYYQYNKINQFDSMSTTYGDQYVQNTIYNNLGFQNQMIYGNGAVTEYKYIYEQPNMGYRFNLQQIIVSHASAGQYFNTSYDYDKTGNMVVKNDQTSRNFDELFEYDALGRLVKAKPGDVNNALYPEKIYGYDEYNNITQKDGRDYSYPAAGSLRPHAVTNDGNSTYEYDINGNMVTRALGGITNRTLVYNYDNRIISIDDEGIISNYSYDAGGQRLLKTEGNVTTVYFFPTYQEEWEDGAKTNEIKYYFAGGKRIAERSTKKGLTYMHGDHLGSTVVVTNPDGSADVDDMRYTPFGSVVYPTQNDVKYQFTGQEKDHSTGLNYYNARYYDAALGRFLTADPGKMDGAPLKLHEITNPYIYCGNNPVKYTDPSGKLAQAAVGAGIGFLFQMGVEIFDCVANGKDFFDHMGNGGGALRVAVSTGVGALSGGLSSLTTKGVQAVATTTGNIALAAGVQVGASALSGATTAAISKVLNNLIDGKDAADGLSDSITGGAIFGAISGALSSISLKDAKLVQKYFKKNWDPYKGWSTDAAFKVKDGIDLVKDEVADEISDILGKLWEGYQKAKNLADELENINNDSQNTNDSSNSSDADQRPDALY